MWLQIVVVEGQVQLLLAQDVLASEVTGLLDGEGFDAEVVIVFNYWFQDVYSAGFEPGVRPFSKVEIFTH